MSISLADVVAARERISAHVQCTPCNESRTLSAQLDGKIFIKFENQQFTASFKERGALNFLLARGEAGRGVIAMSAGNHAQALAYHGSRLGVPTTIVMPRSTPNAKVEATRVHGAEVILHGAQFDETRSFTERLAAERNLELVHPFDDPLVIAGQGTVALEILEQVPDLDVLIVPVGGGGLLGGIATVCHEMRPQLRVVGVQMARYPGAYNAFHDNPAEAESGGTGTVAEGIAVKSPGQNTIPLLRQWVDEICLVDEADVEQAIFDLLEIEKTVAEGAGAAPLALLRTQPGLCRDRRCAFILSGGNIDMMVMSSVLQRGLVRSRRLVRMQVEIPDTPGALAALTAIVGEMDSNILDIDHQRAFGGSSVRATVVELVLQMRGEEQHENVARALADAGYVVEAVDHIRR